MQTERITQLQGAESEAVATLGCKTWTLVFVRLIHDAARRGREYVRLWSPQFIGLQTGIMPHRVLAIRTELYIPTVGEC